MTQMTTVSWRDVLIEPVTMCHFSALCLHDFFVGGWAVSIDQVNGVYAWLF